MPIVFAPIDTELTIIKILADEKTRRHLESLGVVANGKITVISSAFFILYLLSSKFVPKYTFLTMGSAASSSAVPALRTLPSNRR